MNLRFILVFLFYLSTGVLVIFVASSPCEVRAPRFLSSSQRFKLCQNENTTGLVSAECARTLKMPMQSSRNAILAVDLCSNVTSIGPAVCFNAIDKRFDRHTKLRICTNAIDANPALCANTMAKKFSLSERQVVKFCENFGDTNVSIVVGCVAGATKSLQREQKLNLCRLATNDAPVECAKLMLKKKFHAFDAVAVCAEAKSLGPVDCMNKLKRWKIKDRTELCHLAPNDAPAECALEIRSPSIKTEQRIQLCKGIDHPETALCVNALRGSFSMEDRIRLCKGTTSTIPAQCVDSVHGDIELQQKVALCEKVESLAPAKCYKKASHGFSTKHRLELCRGAKSNAPNNCAAAVLSMRVSTDLIVRLCRAAETTEPALCFNAKPFGISEEDGVFLCRNATSTAPSECARNAPLAYSPSEKIELCKHSIDTSPSDCAHYYTSKLGNTEKVQLCKHATSIIPAKCFQAAPSTMKAYQKIELCQKAQDLMPADCAQHIPTHFLAPALITQVCAGASTMTPAHCAIFARVNRFDFTLSQIEQCRTAVQVPSGMEFKSLTCECAFLVPNCKCSAVLFILDQFSVPMDDANGIQVVLQPPDHGLVQGSFVATSDHGVVHFPEIRFTTYGNFTITFQAQELLSTGVHFTVAENVTERLLLEGCARLYNSLLCHPEQSKTPLVREHYVLENKWYLQAHKCSGRMEEAGMEFIATFARVLVISANPLSYQLITELGLPKEGMTPWEKLNLDKHVDMTTLRRAYKKKSLDWHPDRWATFPLSFQRKAEQVFQQISDAYVKAAAEIANKHSKANAATPKSSKSLST